MTADLMQLAGHSTAARALLTAARDGIDPADIDRLVNAHTVPTVGQPDTRRWTLLVDLEVYVDLWAKWHDSDPHVLAIWDEDEIDAELLAALHVLTTGQPACRCTNRGGLRATRPPDSFDDLHAADACPSKERAA